MANKDEKYRALVEQRRAAREAEEAAKRAEKKKKTMLGLMYTAIALVLVVATVLLVWRPWSDNTFTSTTSGNDSSTVSDVSDAWADWEFKHDMDKKHYVQIDVKDYGTIKLELDPTYTPITVDNFLTLVEEGFYDGLTFHRIMEGFMVQGGDPNHNGTGGSNVQIKGEFSINGVENPLSHKRGVVSMARQSYPYDSASSQFFIVHEDSTFLDGSYAAFGVVTEGMDVVDAIAEAAEPTDDNGTIPYEKQPVITKISIIEG